MEFLVEHKDATLFCKKQGTGPLLLLIHGVACDSDYFNDTVDYLQEHFTVLTYDRRGYSRSILRDEGVTKEKFSAQEQAEDAAWIIREQAMGKAFVVGCSAGGIIALMLALKYPNLVNGLLLQEPPIAGSEELQKELDDWNLELSLAAEKRRVNKALLSFVNVMGGTEKQSKMEPRELQIKDIENLMIFIEKEREDFLQYKFMPGKSSITTETNDVELLCHLEMPCLVVAGEGDKEGLFSRAAISMAKKMDWQFVRVPGFHNLPIDRPKEFAMIVHDAFVYLRSDREDESTTSAVCFE